MKKYKDFSVRKALEAIKDFILKSHAGQKLEASKLGMHHAKFNAPKPNEPLKTFIQPIIAFYGVLWSDVRQRLKSLKNDLEATIEGLKERAEQLNTSIGNLEHKIAHLELELPNHNVNFPWLLFVLLMACLVGVMAAETLYNGKVLQLLRQNPLITGLLALGISFGMILVSHVKNKFLKDAKSKKQKVLIIGIWIVGFTTLFYLLGEYRNQYVESIDNGGTEFSVLLYVLLNWVMLIAADIILSRLPNTAMIKEVFAKRALIRKIRKLQTELWELQEELETVLTSIVSFERDLVNLPSEEHDFEQLIRHSMNQSVADFLSENRKHRSDGECALGEYEAGDNHLTLE